MPITLYYFSPYIIVDGAANGLVSASLIVFVCMFVASLLAGRVWCGWLCPAGALQEFATPVNDRPAPGGKANWIKWGIWLPWVGAIAALAVGAGGFRRVEPFYNLDGGVTLLQPYWYMIYYIVIALFLGLALLFGRRAGCHYVCWMAPFMILGRRIRNAANWPALRLEATPSACTSCERCTRTCPMGLDVHAMVQRADMENSECILCGNCVDGCTQGAIHFSFSANRKHAPAAEQGDQKPQPRRP
ncbi:MAG: 4Fe-4S binding protein [Anaerolineae bacterium]|nr:4Fe-4S binding protein [Anaerolineae bacterium]